MLLHRPALRHLGAGGAAQGRGQELLHLSERAAPSSRSDATPHLLVGGLCLGLLVAVAVAAQVVELDHGRLEVAGYPVPGVCAFHNLTGLPCAGCGLTRASVALASGDLAASLRYHRLGWLVLLYVAAQALRHGAWLAAAGWRPALDRGGRLLDWALVLLVVALLANWVVTLATL